MSMHLRYFTVRGRGEFPLDMLRYDSCWPQQSVDADKISPTYDTLSSESREDLGRRDVFLCKHTRLKTEPVATTGRWHSFGWDVVKED